MSGKLVWHPRTEELINSLTGRLPQALIIEGPSGIGVRETAKYLAKSVGSPELIIEPKKSQNGQMVVDMAEGNIIIEDIRQLYGQTRTRQPDAHVYIFDTGERSMTVAAQNAFLKLLEEPRDGLYFVIATHHADQLLPTIVSRSQKLSLLPVTTEQTAHTIQDLDIEDATKRTRLAFVGAGLPALIRTLANDHAAYEARIKIMGDAKAMIGGSHYDKLRVVHAYKDSRPDAITLLDDMNHQLKVIVQSRPDPKLVKSIERHLETRERILSNGNVRLHLANDVL